MPSLEKAREVKVETSEGRWTPGPEAREEPWVKPQ